jgi:hypothetical protein
MWVLVIFWILLISVILIFLGSYALCLCTIMEMCHKNMCFTSYTPLYWLMWIELILGSIVMAIGIIFAIDAYIEYLFPGCKKRYVLCMDQCCITCGEKCIYWINGTRPRWQNPAPVDVERTG